MLCDFCSVLVSEFCQGSTKPADRVLRKEASFAESSKRCELCRLIADNNKLFAQSQVDHHIYLKTFRLAPGGSIFSCGLQMAAGRWVTERDSSDLAVWTMPGKFQSAVQGSCLHHALSA